MTLEMVKSRIMLNERQECEWIGLGKQRHQEEVAENRGWVEQKKMEK